MSDTPAASDTPEGPSQYQIRLQGHLDDSWTGWFGGLSIMLAENGETLLTGPIVDQAALHSLLRKVRDLGMPLLEVSRIEPSSAGTSEINP
jgi:hypothetical protein